MTLLLGLYLPAGCTPPPHGPIQVWAVGGTQDIAPGSEPSLENLVYSASQERIRLSAAVNDWLSFQVGLRAGDQGGGRYDLRLSALEGPAGSISTSRHAQVYRIHNVRVERFRSWYPAHLGRRTTPRVVPEILVPWNAPRGGGPLGVEAGLTQAVWIDLHVPPATDPGEYRGRLEVVEVEPERTVFTCDVHLTVHPVAIPGVRSLPIVARVDPRRLLAEHLNWPRMPAAETRIIPGEPSHQAARSLLQTTMQMLHEHRLTPVLWASFPKYRVTGPRQVQVDWAPYDALVAGWIDGSAFADRVPLTVWPVPASIEYPNAQRNGGFESPRYARLLSAYLEECHRHFEQHGWLDRAFVRVIPPEPLSDLLIARTRRLVDVVSRSETRAPFVAHLPIQSLRPFGWHDAPAIDLQSVDIWAPPASWLDPQAAARERGLGRRVWFVPDDPPYSGALAVEAPATDARSLAWQAARYDIDGVWIEDALGDAPLLYPGKPFGLAQQPLPSIRLKRLRAGQLDYERLRLLRRAGKPLLAARTARQVVPRAFLDACRENLLSTRRTDGDRNAQAMPLARTLVLEELAAEFAPSQARRERLAQLQARWGQLTGQNADLEAAVVGVRLAPHDGALRAHLFTRLSNTALRLVRGAWRFPALPFGWSVLSATAAEVPAEHERGGDITLSLEALAYNRDGVYPLAVAFEPTTGDPVATTARLAVASCPLVENPPTIDGVLDDWIVAANNSAADFRLVRPLQTPDGKINDLPTLPTRAFFSMDARHLYVAIHCGLARGETPQWRPDNIVPVDGAIPWGQDLVEVLLNPRNTRAGTGADLYTLQVKPGGALIARRGALTEPPMNPSEPWATRTRVAARIGEDAWVVELAIPLDELGEAARRNRVWGVNVTRLDARRGEYASWSGARGYCYLPGRLGNLILLRR